MLLESNKLYKLLQKRYSRRINLDLNRIQKILKFLGNPELNLKNPINILGSDGKMSVLTSLKFFLEADNINISAFTSPHLYDFRSRIYLKNKFISLRKVLELILKIEKTKHRLTLFELLTCIYILAVKEIKNISYNLIESGLLFKKDSTNLWSAPRAQIITNINFQHQEWINPKTIEEICRQKVGFLSKKTTIYIAPQEPKTLKIIKKILNNNPSKKIYSSNWKINKKKNKIFYADKKHLIPIKTKYINSDGLINNLGLAIKVALDLGVKKQTIIKTIPRIKFEGRVQYIQKGKLVKLISDNEKLLIDGCHSDKSAKNLYIYLKTLKNPIYGIWGMQKNKLPKNFIANFKGVFKKLTVVKIPNEPNSCSVKDLKKIAFNAGFKVSTAPNITRAIKNISNKTKKTIVVFGSLYLVGNLLSKN
jgi:dihydrofolate synthase/folylpolyglutamate synthase